MDSSRTINALLMGLDYSGKGVLERDAIKGVLERDAIREVSNSHVM